MFKKLAVFLGTILACGLLAAAQEVRSEITVSGTGLFTKDSSNNGLQHKATQTGGGLAGLRFNINRWSALEMNYGWNRNSQEFFTASGAPTDRIQSNIHQLTADFVGKIPTRGRFRPYVLAGGGTLIFDPVRRSLPLTSASMTIPAGTRVPTRAEGAFVYGAGTDFDLTARGQGRPGVALRLGYRGFVYGVPDFGFSKLDLKTMTHTAQPEAGLTFRF
jgi:outer membrane immunogenic protein